MRSVEEQLRIIKRGAAELIDEAELRQKLTGNRRLRVKAGFDPTAADLHLGHTVLIEKLRQFQELGHQVVFLIGDFTARIGDPTGRSDSRPMLSDAEIRRNAETYQEQAFKILDREATEVAWNRTWCERLGAAGLLMLASEHTVARLLERDDFQKRYKGRQPIGLHEFLYPILQGYDSVELRADVELGGTDQKFNLLVGRDVQRNRGQAPQVVLTMPLLEGLDGVNKMSKSLGNAVGVTEPAVEMYGKLMSISDELMVRYYELLSSASAEKLQAVRSQAVHPMEAKKALAAEITGRFHGAVAAAAAEADFRQRFQKHALPDQIPEFRWPGTDASVWICRLLAETQLAGARLAKSNGEARRLIAQGGVKVDGVRVTDADSQVEAKGSALVQVGKRRLVRVMFPAVG